MKLDIRNTNAIKSPRWWDWYTPSIAVAQGVTSDGRYVVGIGETRWGSEKALDRAVEDLKKNAKVDVDFSYRLKFIETAKNERIEFLDNRGEIQKKSIDKGAFFEGKVGVIASQNGRKVEAEAKVKQMSGGIFGQLLSNVPDYSGTLVDALDKAANRLERTGTVEI